MRRMLIVVAVVIAAVTVVAGPARAKGEGDPLQGSLVISGPGIDKPIVVNHAPGDQTSPQFGRLLDASGMSGAPPEEGWYELAPDRSTLGPRYRLDWVIRVDGRVYTLHQWLYPFTADRPWFYTPKGQLFRHMKIGEWWSAPTSALSTLHDVGLPRSEPLGSLLGGGDPGAQLPAANPVPAPPSSRLWVWAATIGALSLLLVAGVVSGRRRGVRAG